MNWLRKDSGRTAKAIYYCHKSRFTLSNWTQLHGGILMTRDHVFCPQIIFIKWTRKAIESAQVVLLWYSASAVKRVVLYYHVASIKEWTIDIYCPKRAFKARILRTPLKSRFTSKAKSVSRAHWAEVGVWQLQLHFQRFLSAILSIFQISRSPF